MRQAGVLQLDVRADVHRHACVCVVCRVDADTGCVRSAAAARQAPNPSHHVSHADETNGALWGSGTRRRDTHAVRRAVSVRTCGMCCCCPPAAPTPWPSPGQRLHSYRTATICARLRRQLHWCAALSPAAAVDCVSAVAPAEATSNRY